MVSEIPTSNDKKEIKLLEYTQIEAKNLEPSFSKSLTLFKHQEKIKICEKCQTINSGRLITQCYLCKKVLCRICAGNQDTAKKKEHSNLICLDCIKNQSVHKR